MLAHPLTAFFKQYPASSYLIAYSGGLDSHALLHACVALRDALRDELRAEPNLSIRAIHIDHGLQSDSVQWAQHCQTVCKRLAVPFVLESLHVRVPDGESTEAVARDARYQAFIRQLQPDEILLTAHHQNDQAETLLLNLLRGSGAQGLAAMPAIRALGAGRLGRPLLAVTRTELQTYAQAESLQYIDDPSNDNREFDRNYLRHEVMPQLEQRWSGAVKTLARGATLQGETSQLLAELLAEKLQVFAGTRPDTLSVSALLKADAVMQKALLRQWLQQGVFALPEAKKLQHVLTDVLQAKPDATPCVAWQGCEIRRYRDDVYAMPPLAAHDATQVIAWNMQQDLVLPDLGITVDHADVQAVLGQVDPDDEVTVTVRFRQGGERLQRDGTHSLSLKQAMQEAGIPPWQRERVPLVFVGDELRYVAGISSSVQSDKQESTDSKRADAYDVAISYAIDDSEWVQKLQQALELEGFTVSLRHDKAHLQRAESIIVVWSKASVREGSVRVAAAEAFKRRVAIPVLMERARLPMPFSMMRNFDIRKWQGDNDDPRFQQLLRLIRFYTDTDADELAKRQQRAKWLTWASVGALLLAIVIVLGKIQVQ